MAAPISLFRRNNANIVNSIYTNFIIKSINLLKILSQAKTT